MLLFQTAKRARMLLGILTGTENGSKVFDNNDTSSKQNPLSWSFNNQQQMQRQLQQNEEKPAEFIVYQKAIPYMNVLSYLLLNKGLLDLSGNIKLIKNKVNIYNLPNFNQFVNSPAHVNQTLKSLSDDSNAISQYKNHIGGLVAQDMSRYGNQISNNTR